MLPDSSAINQRGPDTDNYSITEMFTFSLSKMVHIKFQQFFFQFPFFQMLKNRYYRVKVLTKRFHLNGDTLGFHSQTQKLEQQSTA